MLIDKIRRLNQLVNKLAKTPYESAEARQLAKEVNTAVAKMPEEEHIALLKEVNIRDIPLYIASYKESGTAGWTPLLTKQLGMEDIGPGSPRAFIGYTPKQPTRVDWLAEWKEQQRLKQANKGELLFPKIEGPTDRPTTYPEWGFYAQEALPGVRLPAFDATTISGGKGSPRTSPPSAVDYKALYNRWWERMATDQPWAVSLPQALSQAEKDAVRRAARTASHAGTYSFEYSKGFLIDMPPKPVVPPVTAGPAVSAGQIAPDAPVSPYSKESIFGLFDQGTIKKQRVGILDDLPAKNIPELRAELEYVQSRISLDMARLRRRAATQDQELIKARLKGSVDREEHLLDELYNKGFWEAKKSDQSFEYNRMVTWSEHSGEFVYSGAFKETPWTLPEETQDIVNKKKGVFTTEQTDLKKSVAAELKFIENVLTNAERAAEYERKIAGPYFYQYWTGKGGITDLQWYRTGLKAAMQTDEAAEITPLYAKYGKIKTIAEAKTHEGPPFASLQGKIAELWEPSSPMIKQVGLVEDISGERIKFTTWKSQGETPTFEVGDRYYFGNVFIKEFQGKWGLEIKSTSRVEKAGGQMFYVGKPTTPMGTADIRDYEYVMDPRTGEATQALRYPPPKIDPKKGTITYTTKGGKVVEAPIPKADMGKKIKGVGDAPSDDISQYSYGDAYKGSYGLLPLPFLALLAEQQMDQTITTGGSAQQIPGLQAPRRSAGRELADAFSSTYSVLDELGGKWLQKGQEAYVSAAERGARYNLNPEENAEEPYLAALDVLGGAFYPLMYPMQAVWGQEAGIGAMEGIRQEITPSQALGLEDPWQALGADILGDPINLLLGGGFLRKLAAKSPKIARLLESLPFGLQVKFGEGAASGELPEAVLKKMRERAFLRNSGKADAFFEGLYGPAYNKVKSDYIALYKMSPDEFDNKLATSNDFANRVVTDVYTEFSTTPGRIVTDMQVTEQEISSYVKELAAAAGRTPEEQFRLMKGEAIGGISTEPTIRQTTTATIYPAEKAATEKVLGDVTSIQAPRKTRLEYLSEKDYESLSLAEKSELDRLIHKFAFKDVGKVPEQPPLTQQDWLGADQYNTELQRAMKEKSYGKLEPKAVIDGKQTVPMSDAERAAAEKALSDISTQVPRKTRLEYLSEKDYESLSLAEKSELDRLIHKSVFKDVGEVPAQVPLTQEDWLGIDRYNTEVQRAMTEKSYGKMEPTATIGGKPPVPISEAEKERTLKELAEYRKLVGIAAEERATTTTAAAVTKFPKQEVPTVSAADLARAQADETTEAMVQDTITRREVRGEITTPDDIQQIRETIVTSQKEAGPALAKAGVSRLSSQDKWLLGGGVALAGAGWAGYELTKKEKDPWAEASTPLPQVPMYPGYTGRSSKHDPFAAYGGIENLTASIALPTAHIEEADEDGLGLLWKAVDILSTVSYAEGAAIDFLKTGEWKGIGAKIMPSEALGITPEGEDVAWWRQVLGFGLDIGIDPTTYLSFGAGSAVKVVGTGGSKLALSAKGVKELGTMRKALTPETAGIMKDTKRLAMGEELGTKEFVARIESDPAFRKKVLSSEGMSLRGWGPLFPGMEKEILSKQSMDWILAGPKAVLSAAGETSVGQGLARKFVAFHDIKKLARPAHMPAGEAEYVDKYFSYKKKVPYLQKQAIDEASGLAKQAKEVLGEDYQEIMAQLIEMPVTRGASDVPAEARRIVEVIEAEHKLIAEAEKARGILGTEIESMGYLKHMLTPEAREYLKAGKKIPGDISGKWGTQTGSSIQRGYKGTLTEINEEMRKTLGFDLFEPDPFTAFATRKVESIKAVETYDYLEYVEKYYGKASVPPSEAAQFDTVGIQQLKGVNLPKPIAEHLGEEFVARKSAYRETYDKLLTAWKYGATVPFPAYHAQNVAGGLGYNAMLLGDTSVLSVAALADILKGTGRSKKYTNALGQELTGEQILQKLGEHGVLGQPGQMDIPLEMRTKLGGAKTLKEVGKDVVEAPVKLAMAEEDVIRGSMSLDRWLKGDTWEQAADWAIKHQFGYSPERYTPFERAYILPTIPFYKFAKGNIQLQFEYSLTQPGKQLILPKATERMAGEDEQLDEWVFGYAATNLNAQAMGTMGFREDTFAHFRTPLESMQIAEKPLEYIWTQSAPWFKLPGELATGGYLQGEFTAGKYLPGTEFEKDYEDMPLGEALGGAAPFAYAAAGRSIATYGTITDPYKTPTEKIARSITSTGTAQLPSAKEADELFKQQFARPGSTTYEQRKAIWKRDQYMSGSGISGLQLQTGHIIPAEWGGEAVPENLITQTYEENMEQAAAQMRRQSLPWRIEQEKEFIKKLRLTSAEKLEEASAKKDEWGRAMNAAQLEKVRYDRRKSDNVKLYQRLIDKVNTEINWTQKELYTEEKDLEEKKAKGIEDPFSEAQILAMKNRLVKLTTKQGDLTKLKEDEQAKEFELPAQVTEGERFRGMNIGRWDEYTVRYGKGPELAKEEDILSLAEDAEGREELISPLVDLEELTLEREVVLGAPWAVDYAHFPFYSQKNADLMWTATEPFRKVQAAADPLIKELFNESIYDPTAPSWTQGKSAQAATGQTPVTSGSRLVELRERGEVPAEAGTGAGKCCAIDYENDQGFRMAVQGIVSEMFAGGNTD